MSNVVATIAEKGDKAWDAYVEELTEKGSFASPIPPAHFMARNFSNYHGKYMFFPRIDFSMTRTDKNGRKYFYCPEPNWEGYVLEYHNDINEKLREYSYVVGSINNDGWEIIGQIDEAFTWWAGVVYIKLAALRIPGMGAAFVKDGTVEFVGSDLIREQLEKKRAEAADDIPKNLTELPADCDPLLMAKLFFHLSSVEKNKELWEKTLTKDHFSMGKPASRTHSHWNNLTSKGRSYFYVRTAEDEPELKKYFFQITAGDENVGSPKPISVVLEDGAWKVSSATP